MESSHLYKLHFNDPLCSFNAGKHVKFHSIKAESPQVKPFSRPGGAKTYHPEAIKKVQPKKIFPV
jgi:hypothetical protein